jgi:predicted metalloendopeptidase
VDDAGIKFAWEAFVANHQPDESSKRLFFVAMGQTWCEKTREKSAKAAILTDEHPPNKFRVIGTLSQVIAAPACILYLLILSSVSVRAPLY